VGREYPAGSFVVRMQQPFSAFAKQVLEPQAYPDLREYPGGPPRRPYDVTAHTLPLLMGAPAVAVATPFEAELEPVGEARPRPGRIDGRTSGGGFFALGHKTADLLALGRLLRSGVKVQWATDPFTDKGRTFPPGTLLVPAPARAVLAPMMGELGLQAQAVSARPAALLLRSPRVGLYRSWVASMDEGWTRFVFEKQMGVAFETLRDEDVNRGGLRARFDVVVLPDQTPSQILNGHAPGSLPVEFTGGLGRSGAARLREFVEEGGTLVALDTAASFAVQELGLKVQAVSTPDLYCPGALLHARAEGTSALTHGMEPETPIWFESSPVLEPASDAAADTTVILRYKTSDVLASGYLLGEGQVAGRPALLETRLGKGRVVLFGFRPQYRAQSWGTYVPFLNALYLAAASPAR
jgi:hypothetical protein